MSKGLNVLRNIIWGLLFLSLAVNAYFICTNIRNAGQAGSAGEGLEDELNNAAGTITSAERTTEQVGNGLITVSNELGESQATTNKLISTATDSTERCGDVLSTITELREEVQNLEKCVNNNDSNNNNDSSCR